MGVGSCLLGQRVRRAGRSRCHARRSLKSPLRSQPSLYARSWDHPTRRRRGQQALRTKVLRQFEQTLESDDDNGLVIAFTNCARQEIDRQRLKCERHDGSNRHLHRRLQPDLLFEIEMLTPTKIDVIAEVAVGGRENGVGSSGTAAPYGIVRVRHPITLHVAELPLL